MNNIEEYWNIQPPIININDEKNIEWCNKTSQFRFNIAPHIYKWLEFDKFKNKNVLDIGCGSGIDICEYAKYNCNVFGIDITDKAVELSKQRLNILNFNGDINKYDGNNIPHENEKFDLVRSNGVLHHSPNMEHILTEIYRILKPNGKLKLMLYNKNSILYYYSILYLRKYKTDNIDDNKLNRLEVLSKYSEYRTGCPYTTVYTQNTIKDMLWYFSNIKIKIDFPVIDTKQDRKIKIYDKIKFEKTGVVDVDNFLYNFNEDVENKKNLKKYGWHLLIDAIK